MFFEDDIDDSKYCGHLYGLGTNFVVNKNNNSSSASLSSMASATTASTTTTTTTSTTSEATTTTTSEAKSNTNMDVAPESTGSSEDRDGADSSEKSAEDP